MDGTDRSRAEAQDIEALQDAFPVEWREPPLGWDALRVWENEQGVVLPEPYRTFIAETANGSSLGPPEDGGLLPLGWLPPYWPDQDQPRDPAAEFPLDRSWIWEDDERGYQALAPIVHAVYNHGSVVLGAEDGPMYWLLAVTGPSRGKVWLVADVGAHLYPQDPGIGFTDWVRRWQDRDGWWD